MAGVEHGVWHCFGHAHPHTDRPGCALLPTVAEVVRLVGHTQGCAPWTWGVRAQPHLRPVAAQRWLINLDKEAPATGAAVLDAADIRDLPAARADAWRELAAARRAAAAAALQAHSGGLAPRAVGDSPAEPPSLGAATASSAEEQRLAAVQRLAGLLLRDLRSALRVLSPSAYPTYRAFVQVCCGGFAVARQGATFLALASPTHHRISPHVCTPLTRALADLFSCTHASARCEPRTVVQG